MAGQVVVPGHPKPKSGLALLPDAEITVAPDACPYVSRGGLKLAAALDAFKVNPKGRVAIDVGSSTGGFTDCMLQRGAKQVYAVDVGTKQLDSRLRDDPRVVVMENTHARTLREGQFDPAPDLCVMDLSFISITKVLENVLACLAEDSEMIALVKPQFELEPKKVPKGIVQDDAFRKEAVDRVRTAARRLRLKEHGLIESPLKGARGNIEYLLYLCKNGPR